MDAAQAVAQPKGARDLGKRLHDAASQAGALALKSHTAGQALDKYIDATGC